MSVRSEYAKKPRNSYDNAIKINLGCGIYPLAGFVNIDGDPSVHPDIVRDLSRGLPFSDNVAEEVMASHVLEHLSPDDFLFVLSEIYRVLVPGGLAHILVPLGVTADPTHRIFFTETSFDVFLDQSTQDYYRRGAVWTQVERRVIQQKSQTLELLLRKSPQGGETSPCAETSHSRGLHEIELKRVDGPPQLHLDQYSIVNDLQLLELMKTVCYSNQDVRAGWYGPGLPFTQVESFFPWANWAVQHWAMYSAFLDGIPLQASLQILDLGCGSGHATRCLSHVLPNAHLTGVDLDPVSITFAKAFNAAPSIEYVGEDVFNYNPQKRFDIIFALEILEHLPAQKHYGFLDRALSMLAPGGFLLMTTPNGLDDVDEEHGHIGLLNRERAKAFYSRYTSRIRATGFYDNWELLSMDPSRFFIPGRFEDFEATDRNRSHFRFVLA